MKGMMWDLALVVGWTLLLGVFLGSHLCGLAHQ